MGYITPQSTKCIHFHPFITKTRLYRRNIQVPWTSIYRELTVFIYGIVVVSYILSYLGYRSVETLQRVLLLETFAAVGTAAIDERTDETGHQSPVPAESGDATEMVHGAESCARDRPRIG